MLKTVRVFLLCLVAVACSPVVQKAGDGVQAPQLLAERFVTADGYSLPLRVWKAPEERAVVIAVHGFNDYSNAFTFPASWWQGRGISTYAYDQRGFGETLNRGIWAGEDLLTRDLAAVVTAVRRDHPEKPVFLLGESMGGAVVMTAVTGEAFPDVDGIILSAPAVWGWQALNPLYKVSLWVAAHLLPGVTATGQGLGIQASDNIPMLRGLGADPLFIKETRFDAMYGVVGLMDRAYDVAAELEPDILVLYGANDEVIPRHPVEDVVARLPEGADVVLYEQGWHLLLRDLQAEVVWRDIESWIASRTLPSGKRVATLPLFPDD
ncbi:alpha/beta hydrolase [Sneathiella chinensis]|uniref:Alpha/beta hydrolase n=1 Tax=Sneathiella chinensis TaxID=349750 RepID=A0ABQ5U4E5_9PROT|nr:alpha/beta hydrolase [Sneathiella chinensis]GLQ07009.1 alpha/beta hydrolase [Sneathiella chinensis]